jgi:hypothetical protein
MISLGYGPFQQDSSCPNTDTPPTAPLPPEMPDDPTCGRFCEKPPTGCPPGYLTGSFNNKQICYKSSPNTPNLTIQITIPQKSQSNRNNQTHVVQPIAQSLTLTRIVLLVITQVPIMVKRSVLEIIRIQTSQTRMIQTTMFRHPQNLLALVILTQKGL